MYFKSLCLKNLKIRVKMHFKKHKPIWINTKQETAVTLWLKPGSRWTSSNWLSRQTTTTEQNNGNDFSSEFGKETAYIVKLTFSPYPYQGSEIGISSESENAGGAGKRQCGWESPWEAMRYSEYFFYPVLWIIDFSSPSQKIEDLSSRDWSRNFGLRT